MLPDTPFLGIGWWWVVALALSALIVWALTRNLHGGVGPLGDPLDGGPSETGGDGPDGPDRSGRGARRVRW